MIQLADFNPEIPCRENAASLILKRLLGGSAFANLLKDEKERLESARWRVRSACKGSSLADQGEGRNDVSVLMSGWAFRYRTLPDGKRQILDFIFSGALIGFGVGNTNHYGVETITNCTVATLPFGEFRRLLTACPALAGQVVESMAGSEIRAYEHMTSLGRRSARERIAALIVELASRTQCKELGIRNYSIELPLTQTMIGDALGLSNEHVCRILGKLADIGVVEIDNRELHVLDQKTLMREAGMDSGGFAFQDQLLPAAA
jgi:CRP-like cAMP-binding protein